MNLSIQNLEKYGSLIQGCNSEPVPPEGTITLLVKTDTYPQGIAVKMSFLVVKFLAPYNAILGCPGLCS